MDWVGLGLGRDGRWQCVHSYRSAWDLSPVGRTTECSPNLLQGVMGRYHVALAPLFSCAMHVDRENVAELESARLAMA